MMKTRLRSEAAQRFAERRQREQDAPRLGERVPTLATLRLDIAEGRGATNSDPKHSRIIMVNAAPALFALTCADHACRDGGHDLTNAMLRGLQSGSTGFELEDRCYGSIGTAECGRTMHVKVTATYAPEA
jgi:hypothetical protein